MTKVAWRWSVASIATTMLGATALSGPALAQSAGGLNLLQQFAQNVTTANRVGGGGGVDPGKKTIDPGPRGGAPGAGGPLPGLGPNETAFFFAAQKVFNEVEGVAMSARSSPLRAW